MSRLYTITEALQELKLLTTKIDRLIDHTDFVVCVKSDSNLNPADVGKDIPAMLQKLQDLLARRSAIKSAILQSNATTQVEIGGKMYTVAEAIAHKEYVKDLRNLLDTLIRQKGQVTNELNQYNAQRQQKIDNLIERSFGREGTNKQNPEDIKSITEIYIKKNYMTIVDPINIDAHIAKLQEDVDTFTHTVDHKLSYINAITTIHV